MPGRSLASSHASVCCLFCLLFLTLMRSLGLLQKAHHCGQRMFLPLCPRADRRVGSCNYLVVINPVADRHHPGLVRTVPSQKVTRAESSRSLGGVHLPLPGLWARGWINHLSSVRKLRTAHSRTKHANYAQIALFPGKQAVLGGIAHLVSSKHLHISLRSRHIGQTSQRKMNFSCSPAAQQVVHLSSIPSNCRKFPQSSSSSSSWCSSKQFSCIINPSVSLHCLRVNVTTHLNQRRRPEWP